MTPKFYDSIILTLLGFTVAASLILPSYAFPGAVQAFGAVIFCCGAFFYLRSKKSTVDIRSPLDLNLLFLFLWSIVSVYFSQYPINSIISSCVFAIYILFFYLVFYYSAAYARKFIFFLGGISAVLCLYGLYQFFFGFADTLKYVHSHNFENVSGIVERLKSRRIFSTFMYPNAFAGFLILVFPGVAGLLFTEKRYRMLLIFAAALASFALVLTASMGALLSFAAGLLITGLLAGGNLRKFSVIASASAILLFLIVLKLRGADAFTADLHEKFSSYKAMFMLIEKRPFTGYGNGSFEAVYNNASFGSHSYLKYAHNFIFQTAVETGLIGLGFLIATGLSWYRFVLRGISIMTDNSEKIFALSIFTGVTAFIVHDLVDFDVYNFELGLLFMAVAAILMRLTVSKKEL